MCWTCRRGFLLGAGTVVVATRAFGQTPARLATRIPIAEGLCAALSDGRRTANEVRVYGNVSLPESRRTVMIETTEYELLKSLGNADYDFAVGDALTDILNRYDFTSATLPGVYFIDDSKAHNALALSYNIRPGTVGTILIGRSVVLSFLGKLGGGAVRAILAHEAAHLYQYNNNIARPSGSNRRISELQADFAAGWDMGCWIGNSRDGLKAGQAAGEAMIAIGTPASVPTDRASHGFKLERYRAYMGGYFKGATGDTANSRDAFNTGLELANSIVGR